MTEQTSEEYLDEQFPKGKTKFRGQAMVLLALAKIEGKQTKQDILRQVKESVYRFTFPKCKMCGACFCIHIKKILIRNIKQSLKGIK